VNELSQSLHHRIAKELASSHVVGSQCGFNAARLKQILRDRCQAWTSHPRSRRIRNCPLVTFPLAWLPFLPPMTCVRQHWYFYQETAVRSHPIINFQ